MLLKEMASSPREPCDKIKTKTKFPHSPFEKASVRRDLWQRG